MRVKAAAITLLLVTPVLVHCGSEEPPAGVTPPQVDCSDAPRECPPGAGCVCVKPGCVWSATSDTCVADGPCPDAPAAAAPRDPQPAHGCDSCLSKSWQPSDGITLRWSEPAAAVRDYLEALKGVQGREAKCASKVLRRYDIYFGESADPPLLQAEVASGDGGVELARTFEERDGTVVREARYELTSALAHGTTYHWKVVVIGDDGSKAASPVFRLTTPAPPVDTRCPGQPTVSDADGNSYETVKVGTQCWMKGDLALGKRTTGSQRDNGVVEKGCHQSGADCPGLYTWNEATGYGVGSICPAGWHLPTLSEWATLTTTKKQGDIAPRYAGYKGSDNVKRGGACAYYWTATQKIAGPDGSAQSVVLCHPSRNVAPDVKSFNKGSYVLAVRCVRD